LSRFNRFIEDIIRWIDIRQADIFIKAAVEAVDSVDKPLKKK
jgi:hypothetical protein